MDRDVLPFSPGGHQPVTPGEQTRIRLDYREMQVFGILQSNAITYGYYLWISDGEILNLFNNLEKSGVVKISQEDRNLIFSAYRKPWRTVLSLVAIIQKPGAEFLKNLGLLL